MSQPVIIISDVSHLYDKEGRKMEPCYCGADDCPSCHPEAFSTCSCGRRYADADGTREMCDKCARDADCGCDDDEDAFDRMVEQRLWPEADE